MLGAHGSAQLTREERHDHVRGEQQDCPDQDVLCNVLPLPRTVLAGSHDVDSRDQQADRADCQPGNERDLCQRIEQVEQGVEAGWDGAIVGRCLSGYWLDGEEQPHYNYGHSVRQSLTQARQPICRRHHTRCYGRLI